MRRDRLLLMIWLALTAWPAWGAAPDTLDGLRQSGHLTIRAWMEPSSPVAVRQRVQLHVEVATDRWFSGGTRVGPVRVDDAIVLQRQSFAVNSTRQEGGRTWVVQDWTVSIYPMRAGAFTIPPVPVRLSIAGDQSGAAIAGELHTEPVSFRAVIPEPLREAGDAWIVTPRFELSERFDRELDDLRPGDAVVRTIRMTADDVPAMMLPAVRETAVLGMSVYPKPPKLADKTDRGEYRAERRDEVTYVFEQPGVYHLPERVFYWWNPVTETLEEARLKARTLHVGGAPANDGGTDAGGRSRPAWRLAMLAALAAGAGLWIGLRLFRAARKRQQARKTKVPSERALRREFERACRRNDSRQALRLLYRWMDIYGGARFDGSLRRYLRSADEQPLIAMFEQLMHMLYGSSAPANVDLRHFAAAFRQQWRRRHAEPALRWRVRLTLN